MSPDSPEDRMDPSDEALAQAVQGGDDAAFDALVRRHQGRVFSVAYRMVGNREDALDLAQEAFVKAYRSIGRWRPTGSFAGWLVRITTNVAIDSLRRSKRRGARRSFETDREDGVGEIAGPEAGRADRKAEQAEIGRRVLVALEVLSPSQRSVFVLRHYEGMTMSEIGEALELATGTVKIHLYRAVRKLRDELGDLIGE